MDWHCKPPSNVRSVNDALAYAERLRLDLPQIIQVRAIDWDEVILADEIKRLNDLLDEQQRTIKILNTLLGGEGSTTLENIREASRLNEMINLYKRNQNE
jgi:hypothetical protein